jgi:polysaccharide biosynthesis protein PslG
MPHLRPQFVAAAPRKRGRFAFAFALTLCVAASSAGASLERTSPGPGQNPRFGFAAGGNLHTFTTGELEKYLDGARAAHAGWIRFDVNWNVIQYRGPTSYNWEPFDRVVRAVTSRGMRVLAGVLFTPPWARAPGTSSRYPPSELADYARFVTAVVERYAPMGVHAYEIWNEPNIASFWAPRPDPARYSELLKLAYAAIKSHDRRATVVSGGLSPYGSYSQSNGERINPLTFLEEMYAAGAASSFDALGWHPFTFPHGFEFATGSAWSQMSRTSPSARSILRAHGNGAKKIWATEFGYPTGSTSRDVSEARQALLLGKSYEVLRTRRWAGPAFFYSYHDNGTDDGNIEQNFGVVRYDYSPKPAYRAYQRAAAPAG